MSIIGKKLPEFTLDAFKKPELVKVSTADVLGKWSIFVFYPADFTFVCPTELGDLADNYEKFKEIREKRRFYEAHPEIVEKILNEGSARARVEAQKVLKEVRKLVRMY